MFCKCFILHVTSLTRLAWSAQLDTSRDATPTNRAPEMFGLGLKAKNFGLGFEAHGLGLGLELETWALLRVRDILIFFNCCL